jgi:hypothetical protein
MNQHATESSVASMDLQLPPDRETLQGRARQTLADRGMLVRLLSSTPWRASSTATGARTPLDTLDDSAIG